MYRAILILLMTFTLPHLSARAADVDIPAILAAHKVSNETIYVNAAQAPVMPEALGTEMHRLGYAGRLTLTLTALRLVDKGLIDPKRPIAKYLPDLLPDDPFTVAVTLRHILSDTSGFAVPPGPYLHAGVKSAPLKNFLIPERTPGQAASDDPVAWALLVHLMETVSGKKIGALVQDEVLAPLGLPADALKIPAVDTGAGATGYFGTIYGQYARVGLIARMARLLIVNEDHAGAPYLKAASYRALTAQPFFRLHPLAPEHMLGTVKLYAGKQAWLAVGGTCVKAPYIMAFPSAHAAFVHFPSADACPHAAFQKAVLEAAQKSFPPVDSSDREAAMAKYRHPATPTGRYVGADRISAWTRDRIGTLAADVAYLGKTEDGLALARPGRTTEAFKTVGPYYYQSETGAPLIFSPYKQGGYMLTGGRLYRHVGKLGDPRYLVTPLPWLLITLATSILHLFNRTDRAWRFMAALGFIGSGLIAYGLYGEWTLWPQYVYGSDAVWRVTLWRTGLNIGLMFVMTMPLYAASFRRRGLFPERGLGAILAGPHLLALSVSAIWLLFILTAWGLAGTFTGP
ncbi:serine hydrolase [Kordiimonas marina]|uniref:serine hydrolase n=1 Tax=Kordiimonas marina TaxID=2872312 RepID=UPI001FF22F82|nr:serine hydrolase domain-containing protein [Kordiimonas marina]MCJ9430565.1 beta-lactamase family protein [Kordiimonas marina]